MGFAKVLQEILKKMPQKKSQKYLTGTIGKFYHLSVIVLKGG